MLAVVTIQVWPLLVRFIAAMKPSVLEVRASITTLFSSVSRSQPVVSKLPV